MTSDGQDNEEITRQIAELATDQDKLIAVAESLTSGQLSAAVGAAPDASEWFLGGVVSYSRRVKHQVLDVPEGPVVTAEAAQAMALGVQRLTGADVTVAVSGAGGPDGQDGQPPGTVFIASRAGDIEHVEHHRFDGEPAAVLNQTIDAALLVLHSALQDKVAADS